MTGRQLTPFEHILLSAHSCAAPSSGYDLKRIFAATPMGVYLPSSGTPYPALRRLEQRGLVKVKAPSGQGGQSARHRRVYESTQTGQAAHLDWLRAPVEPATVSRDLGLHLMRFAITEHLLPPKRCSLSCRASRIRLRRSPRSWNGMRQPQTSRTVTRVLPSTTGSPSTAPASTGLSAPSRRSQLLRAILLSVVDHSSSRGPALPRR